jgi:hypothetical protein
MLHLSALESKLEAVQYLLDQDVSVDAMDNVGVGVAMNDVLFPLSTE